MPGLIGFVRRDDSERSNALLSSMAQAMKEEEWYQTDLYCNDSIGLGRVSLGLMNPEPQPVWNHDGSVCIVMEGELYGHENQKQQLVSQGHQFQFDNDPEFVLQLYQKYGVDFARDLNGAFVAAIWDQRARKLTLVNDHLGLRPLYYAEYNGHFAFSSGVRALLADPALPRHIDLVGIAQAVSYQYLLGDRTLLSQVQLLPPASILEFEDDHYTVRSYWKPQYAEFGGTRSEDDYLEGLVHHLRQAMARQAPGTLPAGINLSGGLDSRMIAGLLNNSEVAGPLHTYTFGIPGCTDARYAREVAKAVHSQHQFLELKPDYLLNLAQKGVRLVDGMGSVRHMQSLANVKYQSETVRLIYTGFFIDMLLCDKPVLEYLGTFDDETAYHTLFSEIDFLFGPRQKEQLFTKAFRREISEGFQESFEAAVAESKSTIFANWHDNMLMIQRMRRFTKNGDELLRSQVICRTPFGDKDLVEYCMSLPPGLRVNRYLFTEAFVRYFQDLAKIPWTKTLRPLMPCARSLRLEAEDQIRWQLRSRLHLQRIPPYRRYRSYVDYDTWMRTSLRGWVEETLLTEPSLERGYFNPQYVRELVNSHMAGEDHSDKLGMLLSLELWHREFIDN